MGLFTCNLTVNHKLKYTVIELRSGLFPGGIQRNPRSFDTFLPWFVSDFAKIKALQANRGQKPAIVRFLAVNTSSIAEKAGFIGIRAVPRPFRLFHASRP